MTTQLQGSKAGLAARFAFALALMAGAATAHAEDSTLTAHASESPEQSGDTGNSLDDSGAFAAQPKRGVVIDEADFRAEGTAE